MNSVRISSAFFAIFLTCTLLFSQGSAGRILGSVTDPTGARFMLPLKKLCRFGNRTAGTSFGFRPQTRDVTSSNPVLGSGGHRAIQLGLKIIF